MENVKVGEYEIIIGTENGKFVFKALRHGEEWINDLSLVDGSNMIMAMAYEIIKLRQQLAG